MSAAERENRRGNANGGVCGTGCVWGLEKSFFGGAGSSRILKR